MGFRGKDNTSTIEAGYVRYVCTDDEMPDVLKFCNDHFLDYVRERTTVEPFTLGIVEGVNVFSTH